MPVLGILIALLVSGRGPVFDDSLDELLAARPEPLAIVFFATDCRVCFDDLLSLASFVEKRDLPVRVAGICPDPAADIRKFIADHSVRVPVLKDERGRFRRRLRAEGLPFTVVVAGGEVVYRDDPYLECGARKEAVRRFLVDWAARLGPK